MLAILSVVYKWWDVNKKKSIAMTTTMRNRFEIYQKFGAEKYQNKCKSMNRDPYQGIICAS